MRLVILRSISLQCASFSDRTRNVEGSRRDRFPRNAVSNISISIYITNFPMYMGVTELRLACEKHGRVLDVFISKKLSKLGKRFGFVRFPKDIDAPALVKDLCSIWMGSFKLFASSVVHLRGYSSAGPSQVPDTPNSHPMQPYWPRNPPVVDPAVDDTPIILKSGDYVIDPQVSKQVVLGKVKEFSIMMVLQNLCKTHGFPEVSCKYLGGMWLLLEFPSVLACYNFRCNETVRGWFHQLIDWSRDFIPSERLIWLGMDESIGSNLASIRVCVESQHQGIISEVVSVKVDDFVCRIRVKEIMGWSPSFFDSQSEDPTYACDAGFDDEVEDED
ncbi:hypothetical protein LXL04_007216 [Taraxacum kok-saghyz]